MLIIPLCLVGIGSVALFFLGYPDGAYAVSRLGTAVSVIGVLAYIVFRDSLARWPHDHWFVRFHKVVTFSKR